MHKIPKSAKFLPGDARPSQIIERMLRVNQAGEYGAERIYAGQLAGLKLKSASNQEVELIRHMYEQELVHLAYFNKMIPVRRVRPTFLQPLWHIGGWCLGFCTALIGQSTAMVCTEAVETIIDEHYASQLQYLEKTAMPEDIAEFATELKKKIELFRAEEIEHRNTAIANGGYGNDDLRLLNWIIMGITKIAVTVAKRI